MDGMDGLDGLDTGDGAYPPAGQAGNAVWVSRLSPMCTAHDLDAFFSFCGKIADIRLRKSRAPDQTDEEGHALLEAIVLFGDDAAQQTALLLNGSTILDRDVCIESAPENWNAQQQINEATGAAGAAKAANNLHAAAGASFSSQNDAAEAPAGGAATAAASGGRRDTPAAQVSAAAPAATDAGSMNSWGSTVSSWFASAKQIAAEEMDAYNRGEYEQMVKEGLQYAQVKGSELGRNLQASAGARSEQIAQSLERIELDKKLKESLARMNEIGAEIDRRLHISDTSTAIARSGAERVHELDENFHLSQRIHAAADGALSNEAIASLIRDINERSRQMWASTTEKIEEFRHGGTGSTRGGAVSMLEAQGPRSGASEAVDDIAEPPTFSDPSSAQQDK